jgi:ABC-2 type transport system ATP-binding protein
VATVIETSDLTKIYMNFLGTQQVVALDNVNLSIERGEIFGFLGPNGAGKTTAVKIFLGLIFPTSGDVRILAQRVTSPRVKRQIGYLPEGSYFPDFLRGEEVLEFYGHLYGLRGSDLQDRITATLDLVGLQDARRLLVRHYSKGMRQRIGLAQALLSDPDILILDEPTTGLDPIARREIRDILVRLKVERGKTLFICSHELLEVELMCDRVAILDRGKVVKSGRLDEMVYSDRDVEIVAHGVSPDLESQLRSEHLAVSEAGRDAVRIEVPREKGVFSILRRIEQDAAELISMSPRKESLEDIFLQAVRGPSREVELTSNAEPEPAGTEE